MVGPTQRSTSQSEQKLIPYQRTTSTAMRFRKLRVAWSVVGGTATVLLVVLWVRSYWWQNVAIWQRPSVSYKLVSLYGRVLFERMPYSVMPDEWTFASYRLDGQQDLYQDEQGQRVNSYWFHIMRYKWMN